MDHRFTGPTASSEIYAAASASQNGLDYRSLPSLLITFKLVRPSAADNLEKMSSGAEQTSLNGATKQDRLGSVGKPIDMRTVLQNASVQNDRLASNVRYTIRTFAVSTVSD